MIRLPLINGAALNLTAGVAMPYSRACPLTCNLVCRALERSGRGGEFISSHCLR